MVKKKLAHFAENLTFKHLFQYPHPGLAAEFPLKGKWHTDYFHDNKPITLELGCGKGEYSVGLATRFPGKNYIGVDIKGARMWRGAKTSNENKLPNIAFLRTRIEFINSFFKTDEVNEIWITFPDPHPGGRNSNKRLTSPWYLNSYRQFLKNKGIIHLKTDNEELFNYTKTTVIQNNLEIIVSTSDLYSESLSDDILSIKTHYEKIFLNAGSKINYICFRLDKEKMIADASRNEKFI